MNIPSAFGDDASLNYLKWVAESDRCLLFVDMEKYITGGKDFASALTTKYIAFWQRYLDLHSTRMRPHAGTPVVIVHSKCDIFAERTNDLHEANDTRAIEISAEEQSHTDFAKLYRFMSANSRDVRLVFLSVISTTNAGTRMGVDALADAVLPDTSNFAGKTPFARSGRSYHRRRVQSPVGITNRQR